MGVLILVLTPVYLVFEFAQLIVAERYIGVKQIRARQHPCDMEEVPHAAWSLLWLCGILFLWGFMAALVLLPEARIHGLLMLLVSLVGHGVRRFSGVRFALVVMTFEAAFRLGFMANLLVSYFRVF